jgi:hypothetical protein
LRCLELPGGTRELDEGREKPRALYAIFGMVRKSACELGNTGTRASLGQPEQAKAGLWLPADLQHAAKGSVSSAEIAATKSYLPQFAVGLTCFTGHVVRQEVLASRCRFSFGFRPPTSEPQHLGTVDTTVAPPSSRERGSCTPLLETCRPLACATDLQDVSTCPDGPAVHSPGRGRLQGTGSRGRGSLVDQCPALVHLAVANQHEAFGVKNESLEVRIGEPFRQLERPPQELCRRLGVASGIGGEPLSSGEIAVLTTFGLVREQPLGALVPACRHRARPGYAVGVEKPEGHARGASPILISEIGAVRSFPDLQAALGGARPG